MNSAKNGQPLIFWVLWGALFAALFVYQQILGNGFPSGKNQSEPNLWIVGSCLLLISLATIIRWVFIPKQQQYKSVWVLLILGLAFTEAAQFFQIFLIGENFPETQRTVFVLSILSGLQLAPTYVFRFFKQSN